MNNRGSVSGVGRSLSLHRPLLTNSERLSKAYYIFLPQEKSSHFVKLTTHLHLWSKLRKRGALPPLT